MILKTKYHGDHDYDESDVITFKKGIPGFKSLRKYILIPIKDNEMFKILHSIEDLEIGLILASPFNFIKDYSFNLDDEKAEKLGIKKLEDVLVLNTVCLNSDVRKITMNLKAPIVINISCKIGEQLILDDEKYMVKYPLFKEE